MGLRIAPFALAALAACGGASPAGGGPPATNAFSGTVSVTSALPGGAGCQGTTAVVTFLPAGAGANLHNVTVAGGGCIQFLNHDGTPHAPAARVASPACNGLTAPASIAAGGSFTTGPLGDASGPVSCDWVDLLNPPGGGGDGPGY